MIVAASEGTEMFVEWRHIQRAIDYIEEIEKPMINVFRAVGRSSIAADVELLCSIVKSKNLISEKMLMSLVWRDIDSQKFDNVTQTAMKAGRINRIYEHPDTKKNGVFYVYTGPQ